MGIKYEIYKYFTDRKQYKNIDKKQIDKLSAIMERFEISEIAIPEGDNECKLLKQSLSRFSMPSNPKGNIKVIVSSKSATTSDNSYHFTPKEFFSLLDTPDYVANTEIPRIINTIENEYEKIAVLGNGAYADTIFSYLSSNPNITCLRLNDSEAELKDKTYTISNSAISEDYFVIAADLRPYYAVKGASGAPLQTFFLRRLYCPFKKVSEYLNDMNLHILPTLKEAGVKIIWVYIPDEARLSRAFQVKKKIRYWERLKRYTPSLYQDLRHKQENNKYLQAEAESVVNDNTRGYSTNYGNGQYINFENGFRKTVGNTNAAANSIYVYGPCFVRGSNYKDSETIPSLIKAQVSDKYNVYNMGSTFHTINFIMREKEYKEGDVVIIFSPTIKGSSEAYSDFDVSIDLTDIYNEIPDIEKHLFDIPVHFDSAVAAKITEKLVKTITVLCPDATKSKESAAVANISGATGRTVAFGPAIKRIAPLSSLPDAAFVSWLTGLETYVKKDSGKNGAIVMNCNPFTNGHRYLIETASRQVDNLYVFVVEEDKSEFKFADRIELVKKGCADLSNVTVLPSGSFVISAQTLPGYFDKKNLGTIDLNAENDLEYFLYIARFFGITVRFAGEEPLDQFTNQYNINMKRTLPRYGVEFIEIPRKESGDGVISASRVRKAMHDGDWDTVEKLVPETTLEFLRKM